MVSTMDSPRNIDIIAISNYLTTIYVFLVSSVNILSTLYDDHMQPCRVGIRGESSNG